MNVIDIVLAVPMAWLLYKGWKRGLVREVATLAGLLVGLWASLHLSQWVAEWIGIQGDSAVLVAFFITFVGALVLAYLLGKCVEGLMKAAKLSVANRLAGAVLGLIKAVCILSVLLGYLALIDRKELLLKHEVKEQSLFYRPVYNTGSKLTASLKQYIAEHKAEWEEKL